LLEGIANSEVEKVTNKVVTCAVDAGVSDSAASTMLVSRQADSDAAQEFYALLGFVPKSPGGGGEGTHRRKSSRTKEIQFSVPVSNHSKILYWLRHLDLHGPRLKVVHGFHIFVWQIPELT